MPPNPQPCGLPYFAIGAGPPEAVFEPKAISFIPFWPTRTHFRARHCKYLNGQPSLDTIERIAKALNVSIKSLFDVPVAVEGFVSVGGMIQRFNTREEFERVVESRPKLTLTLRSSLDEDDDLPFD